MKKEIENFPGYWIYDDGRVWSDKSNKFLKPYINPNNGYTYISLRDDNQKKSCIRIHKLVANAFIPNPENLPEINHKDEDKTNNNVINLEWCNRTYNINYGTRTSRAMTVQPNRRECGQYDKQGNFIQKFESIGDAARNLGNIEYKKNISACMRGKIKSAYGYIWKYIEN